MNLMKWTAEKNKTYQTIFFKYQSSHFFLTKPRSAEVIMSDGKKGGIRILPYHMRFYEVLNLLKVAADKDLREYFKGIIDVETRPPRGRKQHKVTKKVKLKDQSLLKAPTAETLGGFFANEVTEEHVKNGFLKDFAMEVEIR